MDRKQLADGGGDPFADATINNAVATGFKIKEQVGHETAPDSFGISSPRPVGTTKGRVYDTQSTRARLPLRTDRTQGDP